jgi:hypothetical protein
MTGTEQIRRTAGLLAALALLLALAALAPEGARAASLQPIGNFEEPIYVTSDPGEANRLFVVERAGVIKRVEGGAVGVLADLRAEVGCAVGGCSGERGLLSMAPAPGFNANGRFFVDYADDITGAIHVDELQAPAPNAEASISTLRPLLTIPHGGAANHNGGQLQFGPEGDLFISTGDGGGGDDQFHNAQSLSSLLGKVLRVNPYPSGGHAYVVPADNPFASLPAPFDTIWSYGLRNPFRFSFDSQTGDMVIGDVGEGSWEEVDLAPAPGLGAGDDWGWNCREGFESGPATDECEGGTFADPVFAYPHEGGACAIIGGYVARDRSLGGLYGRYVYGDLCTGVVRSLDLADPSASDQPAGIVVANLNSFGEDACGRLYAVSGDGAVSRLVGAVPVSCLQPKAVPPPPPPATGFVGLRVSRRRVERNRRALITAWVSPCEPSRRGVGVQLFRSGRPIMSRRLNKVCTAQFRPRMRRGGRFQARAGAAANLALSYSRFVTIHVTKRKHRHHHRHRRHRRHR